MEKKTPLDNMAVAIMAALLTAAATPTLGGASPSCECAAELDAVRKELRDLRALVLNRPHKRRLAEEEAAAAPTGSGDGAVVSLDGHSIEGVNGTGIHFRIGDDGNYVAAMTSGGVVVSGTLGLGLKPKDAQARLHALGPEGPILRLEDTGERAVELRTGNAGSQNPWLGTAYAASMNLGANGETQLRLSESPAKAHLPPTASGEAHIGRISLAVRST